MAILRYLDSQHLVDGIRKQVSFCIKETSDKATRDQLSDVLALVDALDKPYSIEWVKERYRLSPAEHRILCLLIEGKTAAAIAEETGTQISTVRVHISKIYRRTNVHNYNELTCLLLQHARNS